ncbi:MAG: hypothetical protein WBK76_02790 [Candidatus Saccharimonadales bacterium]
MAKVRNRIHYSDTRAEKAEYKDMRRGAMDDEMWADHDEFLDYVAVSNKKRKKKKRGCPENDFKSHVYVWQTETRYFAKWSDYHGYAINDRSRPYTVEVKSCCGCGKVLKKKYNW